MLSVSCHDVVFLLKMDGYNLSDVIEKVESIYSCNKKQNRTEKQISSVFFKIFSFADFSYVLKNNKN